MTTSWEERAFRLLHIFAKQSPATEHSLAARDLISEWKQSRLYPFVKVSISEDEGYQIKTFPP